MSRRVHSELVMSVLEKRHDASEAAERLGLGRRRMRVVAIAAAVDGDRDDPERLGVRLWDLAAFHLSAAFRPLATTLARGIVYGVIAGAARDDPDQGRLSEALHVVVSRASSVLGVRVSVGIGGTVDLAEVPRSRREADQALRVLRSWRLNQSTAGFDDVRMQVLLLHLSDLVGEDSSLMGGPLLTLAEHDRRHGTRYVATLRAYLDSFGDVRDAARQLRVHVNTFRYRLRKLQALAGVRLDDPDQRLLLMLQQRLLDLGGGESLGRRR